MKFEITDLRNCTVWNLYRMRGRIQLDPDYQRMSDIWTLDKRQLLIDTILNEFDIPKLYLHKFSSPLKKRGGKIYITRLSTVSSGLKRCGAFSMEMSPFHAISTILGTQK